MLPNVNELRQRLMDLDATIAHHEGIVEGLKQDRDIVFSQLSASVSYPILMLPNEITAEIFNWCYVSGLRLAPSTAPMLLTRICHAWRELAFSIPALWHKIDEVELTDPVDDADFIATWFSRAGALPLSLGMIYPEHLESHHLQSLLHCHAQRWQSLDVAAHVDTLLELDNSKPFPGLVELSLASLGQHEQDLSQVEAFRHTPSLRRLSIDSLPPSLLDLPWTQLTKTTFRFISIAECLSFLRLATSLSEFYRTGIPEDEEGDVESVIGRAPFCHDSLDSLLVSVSSGAESILHFLTVPRLKTLELQGGWETCTQLDTGRLAVPFFSQTCSTLLSLKFPMPPSLPVHWFQLLPNLTTLELVYPAEPLSVVGAIRALNRGTTPDLLPKLRGLVISRCGSNRVDKDLLEVLESRCDAGDVQHGRLESFSLFWPQSEIFDDGVFRLPLLNVGRLRRLAARGMRIHIGTSTQNSFY
ncbi:F-box domain-containing protein [Favolaschia claudopus]|uniref:F-box domain-containing protein n=1 Tax=Favolaschia claudopus TaxID=2862362 RepID=A0AAV9Z723_9AGAR